MSAGKGSRRAVVELKWEAGAEPVDRVGGRSLHQYWPVLSPYFRDVLLPPVRRTDDDAVSWTWREPDGAKAVSAGELRAVRKRLASELEWLAENLARVEGGGGGMQGLAAVMAGVVARLVEGSDAELAGYVARTEVGLRLHSWGAREPGRVRYPDTAGGEADEAGRAGGKRAGEGDTRKGKRRRGVMVGFAAAVVAAVLIRGIFWADLERERSGESESGAGRREAAAVAQPGMAAVGGEEKARQGTGAVDSVRGRESARVVESGRGGVEEIAQAGDGSAAAATAEGTSRPRAQRVGQEEEKRGTPLRPNGRPDQEKRGREGGPGGVLRTGDSEKKPEARTDVLAASDEVVEKMTREEKAREVVRTRGELVEAAVVSAGERRALTGDLREDEEVRESRVRDGDAAKGSGEVVAIAESAREARVFRMREMRVREPRWETRMLVDAIVPTRPVRLGEIAAVESLRERMREEARARIPGTLRELRWRGGVGFESEGGNSAGWRWRGAGGGVREGRAEWEWSEGARILEDASGSVVAEMRAEGEGWLISVREGVRVYRWVAVAIATGERRERWGWRRVTAVGLPEGVVARDDDARMEIALTVAEPLAFFDRESGWAAVAEMRGP